MTWLTKLRRKFRGANGPFLWTSVGIGIAFWLVDAVIDATLLDEGGFVEQFLVPELEFVVMRAMVLAISVAFGLLAQTAINRRKRAEAALREEMVYRGQLAEQRELNARVQADEKARLSFLNTISHELRTPLTVLLTFSRIVRRNRERNLTEQQSGHLDLVVSNAQRLATMIDDLVNLANITSPGFEFKTEQIYVPDLVQEQAESLKPMLAERSQSLDLVVDERVTHADGDWVRIGQVIFNLVGNASKFSAESSRIGLDVGVSGDRLRFSVTNSGDAIQVAESERIFDLFYRGDNEMTRSTSGTGIGLAVCRAIVEKHGGRIWLEPHADGMNRFTFEIPLRQELRSDPVAAIVEESEPARP